MLSPLRTAPGFAAFAQAGRVCAFLSFATAFSARAQTVGGRVVDAASRRPLPGVTVHLLRAAPADSAPAGDTTALVQATTRHDGTFVLFAPQVGTYRVRIGGTLLDPPITLATLESIEEREYVLAALPGRVFLEHEVEKRAATVPGSLRLRYPTELIARGVGGRVVVQVVIDTSGRAEMDTWTVLESTNERLLSTVRDAVLAAEFVPAELGGRRVRQRAQIPFTFTVGDTVRVRRPKLRSRGLP